MFETHRTLHIKDILFKICLLATWCTVYSGYQHILVCPLGPAVLSMQYFTVTDFKKIFHLLIFLALLHDTWDLSSLTRDGNLCPL